MLGQLIYQHAPLKKKQIEKHLDSARAKQAEWINSAIPLLTKEQILESDNISWSSFHASLQNDLDETCAIISLLPMFYDKAASTAMIKHGMHIQKMITEHLNAGQVPVMTFDQPLFALAKCVQWKWPEIFGEEKILFSYVWWSSY